MSAVAPASIGYEVALASREQVAESTVAFGFSRPPGFSFRAGQAVDLVLEVDGAEERHAFSIVNAPSEQGIVVATRMRASPFKQALARLATGDGARLEGPFGSLTLHRAPARDAVFIAGGIGITPFMSILRQAALDRDPRHFTLLYSNRRLQDAAFLDELRRLERDSTNFRLVSTLTLEGEKRLIDAAMIREASGGLRAPVYYLAGPPPMIAAMRQALTEAGVDEDDVRTEEFFGY